jgi:hypothetical protein
MSHTPGFTRLAIAVSLYCLLLVSSSACGPGEEDCSGCDTFSTRVDELPPCEEETGCPGGEEPPPPLQEVRVDVSYQNSSTTSVTTYAAVAANRPTFVSTWAETRVHPPSSGIFFPGVATGEVGHLITFSVTDMSGGPTLSATIVPRTLRVHCRAELVGGGAMGLSCSDG